jgi:hypothetical protein
MEIPQMKTLNQYCSKGASLKTPLWNKFSRFYLKQQNKNVQEFFFNSLFLNETLFYEKKICENFNISTNNVDIAKVLLYREGIEDMSREIENHSSSMCGHRPISQKTYMSFVWACLNTVNELCLALCPALSFCAVGGFYTSFCFRPPIELHNKFDFLGGVLLG